MNGLNEDIDEDLDELDDEDLDESDESLAERRRGRRRGANVRGRGYNQPRLEKSSVTQAQLQAAMSRVGEDVRKLAASTKSLEERVDRSLGKTRKDQQQFNQMAMLLPLLSRPKKITLTNVTTSTGEKTVDVLSAEQDTMSTMLPLLMMGGMGGGGGGNDMMTMVVLMTLLNDGGSK